VPLADFGVRLGAYLIDSLIVGVVTLIVALPVMIFVMIRVTRFAPEPTADDSGAAFGSVVVPVLLAEGALLVFMLICYYLYEVEMMYRSGQTLGKRLMKIRVVPVEPGRDLTRGMAAIRFLVQFPAAMVVPFFTYVDGLWQLWDEPYKQTLHDKAARTLVVKVSA